MSKRIKIFLWLLIPGVIAGLLVVAVLLVLYSSAVQTRIARYVLTSMSQDWNGSIEVETVQVRPSGVFSIAGLSLKAQDEPVAQTACVRGRMHLFSLLHQSLDFDSLIVEGLRAEVDFDSSGCSSIESIFPAKQTTEPAEPIAKPWRMHLRRLQISGEELTLSRDDSVLFRTDTLHLVSAFDYEPKELIVHRLEIEAGGFHLNGGGTWPLEDGVRGAGAVNIQLADYHLRSFIESNSSNDTVSVTLFYSVKDSAHVRLAADWPDVGAAALTAGIAWPPAEKISGWAQGRFFGLRLERFAQTPGWLCGSFAVRGEGPPWETAAIDAQLSLRNSSIDKYAIQRADVHIEGTLADFSGTGKIHTTAGNADMTFRSRDFQSSIPYLKGKLNLENIHVQEFVPDMPEDFPLLSGSVRGNVRGFQPESSEGTVDIELTPTVYRQIETDTISLSAQWQNQKISLSHFWASYKGASIYAHGSGYLDSTIRIHTELDIQDASEVISKLPLPDEFSDTITGSVQVSADAHFRIDTTGFSDVEGRAEIKAHSLTFDSSTVQNLTVSINTFRLSPLFARGELKAEGGRFSDYSVDSLHVSFAGRPDSLAMKLSTSMYGDSLRMQMEGVFGQRDTREFAGDVQILESDIFGDNWSLEKPASFVYNENELSLTDFKLSSGASAFYAAGKLAIEGEQDFSLMLTEFPVGRLRQISPFSNGIVSAQLHFSGDAQSLEADFEVLAESLQWAENNWIDKLTATGKLKGNSLTARGAYLWHGDTLFAFRGELPMSLSYESGAVFSKDKPMSAHLRVHGQPLPKLQPYLPWGVSLGGWAGAEVDISGTLSEPVWWGEFLVEDGLIKDVVHGMQYDKIELRGAWRGDSLFIERMEARASGKTQAHGNARMAFPMPKSVNLCADFDKFQLLNRPDIRAKISGDIELEGPLLGLNARGNITLDELRYRITSSTTKNIEEIDLESELAKLRGDTVAAFRVPGTLIYEKMDQALRVTLPRNCWVHGGGISIELEGDVWLYKSPDEAEQVYGQIRVVRGTVNLYTRKLKVQEGTITFDGDPLDPNLDITAVEANLKRVRDVEIILKLTGTKNHPEIELSGQDPDGELTYEDIVSYLMFGRRASGGSTLASHEEEGSTLGETAATGLSAGVSGLVSQALGLEVFEYRPGSGGLTQGELEVGTYVTDNLFVSIIQSMEEEETGQEVILEYQLLPWLRFQGTREAHGHSGFDLFFHWEWR